MSEQTGSIPPGLEGRLGEVMARQRQRWEGVDPCLGQLLDAMASFLSEGGKRLRPAFCYWSFVGLGGDPHDPGVLDAAAALEMLHASALIHDDLIDASETRRGGPAFHLRMQHHHRRQGLLGDPTRFGHSAAILAGDLAVACAVGLLDSAPRQAREVFEAAWLEMNVGQYLDLIAQASGAGEDLDRAAARARQVCRYKTASYSVTRPLQLGAALAAPERYPSLAEALEGFGQPLGEAFQLRDDLLGVFGDPSITGKPAGDDLRQGKLTLLVAEALGAPLACPNLKEHLGAPDLAQGELSAMMSEIESSGARARVEARADSLVEEALVALGKLPFTPEVARRLAELARFATQRDH